MMLSIILPAIGSPFEGGFYSGKIRIGGQGFALIRAPKAEGQHNGSSWNTHVTNILGARSWNDGLANTIAMAEAGSPIAQWATEQRISGHSDWYIPSMDELEILYRNLKPANVDNHQYSRSGLNASAVPATYPYTVDDPVMTSAPIFQHCGAESFDDNWYWSSTQYADNRHYAHCQDFYDGRQYQEHKEAKLRVILIRRVPMILFHSYCGGGSFCSGTNHAG